MIDEAEMSVWKCFCSFILTLQIWCAKFTEAYAHVHAKQGQSIQCLCLPGPNCATSLHICWFLSALWWHISGMATSSICLSSQTSAPFLIKESTFSCSLQLVCGKRCHRMLLRAKNSARYKKALNANSNNIFFETEIQLIFQFWGQYTTFKD